MSIQDFRVELKDLIKDNKIEEALEVIRSSTRPDSGVYDEAIVLQGRLIETSKESNRNTIDIESKDLKLDRIRMSAIGLINSIKSADLVITQQEYKDFVKELRKKRDTYLGLKRKYEYHLSWVSDNCTRFNYSVEKPIPPRSSDQNYKTIRIKSEMYGFRFRYMGTLAQFSFYQKMEEHNIDLKDKEKYAVVETFWFSSEFDMLKVKEISYVKEKSEAAVGYENRFDIYISMYEGYKGETKELVYEDRIVTDLGNNKYSLHIMDEEGTMRNLVNEDYFFWGTYNESFAKEFILHFRKAIQLLKGKY